MSDTQTKTRTIRSFVKRDSRLTKSQQHAIQTFWRKHGIDYSDSLINYENEFNRVAPVIMDIGVGTGDTTFFHAQQHPENNYLAVEVHKPGIGSLLKKIETNNLTNIKIINHDVIDVLRNQISNHSLSQVFIFFPDPWPKKRHHKRRLINKKLLEILKIKIADHGRLHIATDWIDYAEQIQELSNNDPDLINLTGHNQSSPRPNWRINTRYESRGIKLEHEVRDFCFAINKIIKK